MSKKILATSFLVLLIQFPQAAKAGEPEVRNWFYGWVGHKQSDNYLDVGSWHYCYGTGGGSCGSVSLSVGKSKCTSWGVNLGISYTLAQIIPGLSFSVSASKGWSACNTRSETIGCSPNKGWKGRPEVIATARYGTMRFQGTKDYTYRSKNWDEALHACDKPGYWRADIYSKSGKYEAQCKTVIDEVKAYWPEKRWTQCGYRRI